MVKHPGFLRIVLSAFFVYLMFCDRIQTDSLRKMEIQVGGETLTVEVASTPEQRQRGLMYRNSLSENTGMLFIFPKADYQTFWMKNTLIPLDVGFFDQQGLMIEHLTMEPRDEKRLYPSSEPALYALEVNAGWFQKHNVKKYTKLSVPATLKGY